MLNNYEQLLKDFEQEIWLYIDDSLSEPRKKFWDEKINASSQLRDFYKDSLELLEIYDAGKIPKIDSGFYSKAVNTSTKHSHFNLVNIKEWFRSKSNARIGEAAFASIMAIVILTLLLFLNKPDTYSVKDKTILEWNSNTLDDRLTGVENSVYLLKNNKSIDQIIYNYTRDGWKFARTSIEDQIKQITKEIKDNSF